jgi:hypothetical protein
MLPHHIVAIEVTMLLIMAFVTASQPAYAANVIRLQDRSMLVVNPGPGVATDLIISFTYTTPEPIGSVEILFCLSPIPDDPCTKPAGLDASNVVLSSQTGETGYTIQTRTANRIVLTRSPAATSGLPSTYRFSNFINPTSNQRSYGARLSTHLSTNASDPPPYVNLGSVLQQTTNGVDLATQVPPILIFCLGAEVTADCEETDGGWYSDMGTLDPTQTLKAKSQMAAATNATDGFSITANGTTMQAGTSVIKALNAPQVSRPGAAQFGLNLRENTNPDIGADPDGSWNNGTPTPDYNIPDQFTYRDGDVVASSPAVNLQRRFTVSYIVNSPANLRPGVYSTTITFICSGRF